MVLPFLCILEESPGPLFLLQDLFLHLPEGAHTGAFHENIVGAWPQEIDFFDDLGELLDPDILLHTIGSRLGVEQGHDYRSRNIGYRKLQFSETAKEKNAENLLILNDKELKMVYIENQTKHEGHSGKYEGNDHSMPLTEFTKILIETRLTDYCEHRIPIDVRDQLKLTYKIEGYKVTLVETRPYHRDSAVWTETPIAQFRFDRNTQKWSLFSLDRNDRWHLYDLIKPSMNFDDMLKAIDNDKTGAFWG